MDNFGRYEPPQSAPSPENYQLKWHKFLIYFSLWAGAIINASQAITLIGGTAYGANTETLYRMYGSLKGIDLFWGIALLGLAGYMIYVRFQLAGFRIGAPKKLSILYIANLVCSLAYMLAVCAVTQLSLRDILSDIAVSLFGSIVMLFVNQNYYSKRLELFVN